jgi:hypothetical protein
MNPPRTIHLELSHGTAEGKILKDGKPNGATGIDQDMGWWTQDRWQMSICLQACSGDPLFFSAVHPRLERDAVGFSLLFLLLFISFVVPLGLH